MKGKNKTKSTIQSIVSEIAHDLGIDKKLVRQVLILTFKELAITLLLKRKPVMIRRFVKFVVAAVAMRKIKKYKTKADSIKDFLNMVNKSPNYAGVRETIEAYKKGDATQGDIVDAIQATGWAENPKWADNVKAILGKRIEGKNKSELKQISDKVNFVDKE